MVRGLSGGYYAAGVVTGTDGSTTPCLVNTPDTCYTDVYYSNIDDVLAQLGATLK